MPQAAAVVQTANCAFYSSGQLFEVCIHGRDDLMLGGTKKLPSLEMKGIIVNLEVDPPSPEVMEIARKELRETPDLARESMEELRNLLKEDEELTTPYEYNKFLERFLRPTKFYPESAYDLVALEEVFKACVCFVEIAAHEPETQVCGVQVIFDMDGLSLQQVWQFTPSFAKLIVDFLQEAIPLRVKGFHIVNQPYVFNMVFALFKPFLKEKLSSRIVFHGTDRPSLHNYISPKCLPECYGGTMEMERIPSEKWYEVLTPIEHEFKEILKYGYLKAIAAKEKDKKK
ncbi:CTD2 [Gryllus bimaculatus]|nr:CTD2 [Gryllus bimaculatus]